MRVSIVVLTYNQLEDGTKPCLESIFKFTRPEDYELIIVDNASRDGTPAYLKEFAASHSNVSLVLNDTNKGYAGGNNDGIKLAKGDFVILLNNDTLMTPNWLDLLLEPFGKGKEIGLVSPITNSAGNEQMVVIPNLNESNYVELSSQYVARHKGYAFETVKLGFYCVAISSDAVKKIGLLDERFGIGMFEDDDYCIRAKKAGYRLMINEGCFIFHKGSLSFKKMVDTEYKEQFRRNKEYFSSKHGEDWLFNQITMAFYRQMERELRSLRESGLCDRPEVERISVRQLGFKFLIENAMNIERNAAKSGVDTSAQETKSKRAYRLFMDDFVYGDPVQRRSFFRRCKRRLIPLTEERIISKFGKVRRSVRFEKAIVILSSDDIDSMDSRSASLARLLSTKKALVIFGEDANRYHDVEVVKRVFSNVFLLNKQLTGYLQHMLKNEETVFYAGNLEQFERSITVPHDHLWIDISDHSDLKVAFERYSSMMAQATIITISDGGWLQDLPKELSQKVHVLPDPLNEGQANAVFERIGIK